MTKKTYISLLISLLVLILIMLGAWQVYQLRVAHSTFQNYFNFRGCVQLMEKTDTYGICKTGSGEVIKIVLINGKWYLDGDGPGIW